MGLVAAMVAAGAAVAAAQAPATLSLNDAMARAVEANRTLLAARTARAIDAAGIQAAGQRPNPEVSFEAARETPHWAFTGTRAARAVGQAAAPHRRRERDARGDGGGDRAHHRRRPRRRAARLLTRRSARRGGSRSRRSSKRFSHARARRGAGSVPDRRRAAARSAAGQPGAVAGRRTKSPRRAATLNAARAELNALLAYPARRGPDARRSARGRPAADAGSGDAAGHWPATPSCRCCRSGSTRSARASRWPRRCGIPIRRSRRA